jgi:hypothetical protein
VVSNIEPKLILRDRLIKLIYTYCAGIVTTTTPLFPCANLIVCPCNYRLEDSVIDILFRHKLYLFHYRNPELVENPAFFQMMEMIRQDLLYFSIHEFLLESQPPILK